MTEDRTDRASGAKIWRSSDGTHIDVRGLTPPGPMVEILQLLEGPEVTLVTAHLDREPIFLYPELDERGWAYEILPSHCGNDDCDHDIRLRLVRLRP